MPVINPRVRRLFLLLLLTCTTATAFSADYVDPTPMPRARQVRIKRLRGIKQRIIQLDNALRCCDNQGLALPEQTAPLVLPQGSHFAIPSLTHLPLPQITLGPAILLPVAWHESSQNALVVTLPDQVCSGQLTVRSRGQIVWERRVFVTLRPPMEPQSPPWLGVMEDACHWAEGAHGEEDIAQRLTRGLFASGKFVYQANDPVKHATYAHQDAFSLTELFRHLGPSLANCVDVSDYLAICASALGVRMEILQLSDSEARPLFTNPVCPIGWDPADPTSYQSIALEMHQLTLLPSTGNLYDPTFIPLFAPENKPVGSVDHLFPLWQSADNLSGLICRPTPSYPRMGSPAHAPNVR